MILKLSQSSVELRIWEQMRKDAYKMATFLVDDKKVEWWYVGQQKGILG
jgi:hypothetical protein